MKIGIYQSYWGTTGGGQMVVAAIAEALSETHEVEIVHRALEWDVNRVEEELRSISRAFGSGPFLSVRSQRRTTFNPFVALREQRDWNRDVSAPYDLFVNHCDFPPMFCHAARGMLVTAFPFLSKHEFQGRIDTAKNGGSVLVAALRVAYQNLEWVLRSWV